MKTVGGDLTVNLKQSFICESFFFYFCLCINGSISGHIKPWTECEVCGQFADRISQAMQSQARLDV